MKKNKNLVSSPLSNHPAAWRRELLAAGQQPHDICAQLAAGFDILRGPGGPPIHIKKYKSAIANFEVVTAMVADLVKNDWAAGPFPHEPFKDSYINALAAVPKRDTDELRLVVDCRRSNTNATVTDSPFQFKGMEEAVRLLRPGWHMAKVDLRAAYMHVPIRPDDFRFFCFE